MHSREQSSSSVGTTAVDTPPPSSSSLAAASYQQQVASRQPSTAATAKAAAEGLTLALTVDRPTRRIQSMSARTSSFRSLSPPILSPAYGIEQSQSVPVSTGGAASLQRLASQRATSQRAPSLSPSQSTFSYGAPSPPLGSDIEVDYPAARPSAFQPRPLDTSADVDTPAYVDRARPVAAGVDVSADVGRASLPYADASDVDIRRPGSATGPRQLESATSAFVCVPSAAVAQPTSVDVASAHTCSDTPMPSSNVSGIGHRGLARPVNVDVPRSPDLTLPIASDVAHPYAPPSVDVDVARPAYDTSVSTVVGHPYAPPSVDVPRLSSVDVRRPMPYMGVRQPRSMMNADADEPSTGSARPMRVGDEGRQGVGRLMSVDVVRQPHSSLMGADIANPMPTPRQPSMVDVVHPPSMGAGVVGPMPAHVAYPPSSQSSIGVDVASGIPRRTLADVSHQPPTWTGSKPAYMLVSMLRCVREYTPQHTDRVYAS